MLSSFFSFFTKNGCKNLVLLFISGILSTMIIMIILDPVLASVEGPVTFQKTQENIHDRLSSEFFEETVMGAFIRENPLIALIALWLILVFVLMLVLSNYQRIYRWFTGGDESNN